MRFFEWGQIFDSPMISIPETAARDRSPGDCYIFSHDQHRTVRALPTSGTAIPTGRFIRSDPWLGATAPEENGHAETCCHSLDLRAACHAAGADTGQDRHRVRRRIDEERHR